MKNDLIILFTKDKVTSVFLRNLLLKMGYDNLQITFDFDNFKHKLKNQNPDLIIINRSDLDKKKMLKLYDLSKEKKHLPVLFIRSFDDETNFDEEIIKPYGYVVSPFKKIELENTLQTVLHISKIEKKILNQKKALSKALKDMNTIFNTTDSGLMVINKENNSIEKVNKSFLNIFNLENKNIIGENINQLLKKFNMSDIFEKLLSSMDRTQNIVVENSKKYYEFACYSFDGKEDDEILFRVDDVTDYKNKEKELFDLSHYDQLTGAPNRYYFLKKMNEMIKNQNSFYLYYFDIDDFKEINDILGHFTGDELIKEIYNRLKKFNSENIFTGRLMGDEFVVIIKNTKENIFKITNDIRDQLIKEYEILGKNIFISLTGAIVKYPDDGIDISTLLKHSNISLTEAKKKYKKKNIIFKEKMKNNLKNRINKSQDIKKALENDEFELFFQPQINYLEKNIYGYESLIRWKKNNQYIPPDDFIPFAEDNGLIIEIGEWVMENAFKNLKEFGNKNLSINISPLEFRNFDFLNLLDIYSDKYQIDNHLVTIEITEGALLETDEFFEIIKEIKNMGFKISLDDFGTGYSSLSYLANLPIDELKIDRSFIMKLFNSKKNQTIVNSIIDLSKSLDYQLISEGIEKKEQIDYLLERGCYNFQGYYFSKPLPINKIKNLNILY